MKNTLPIFLTLAMLTATASAQPKAVIEAPEQVNSGDLVVFQAGKSTGDNMLWVGDPKAEGRFLVLDDQLVFAIGTPGEYTFQLIVADTEARIDQVRHTVRVGTPPPPTPPVDPDPPTDPDDPPTDPDPEPEPPPSSKVEEVSRQSAASLNDPATAVAMATAIEAAARQAAGQPLEAQRAAVRTAIESTLLNRSRESQEKDWLGGWRKPVDAEISRLKPTAETYLPILKQAAAGLRAATSATSQGKSKVVVVAYSLPNCPGCILWDANERQRIEDMGAEVVPRTATTGSVPRFEICTAEQCIPVQGYLTAEKFAYLTQR